MLSSPVSSAPEARLTPAARAFEGPPTRDSDGKRFNKTCTSSFRHSRPNVAYFRQIHHFFPSWTQDLSRRRARSIDSKFGYGGLNNAFRSGMSRMRFSGSINRWHLHVLRQARNQTAPPTRLLGHQRNSLSPLFGKQGTPSEMRTCPQCDHPVPQTDKFCGQCGYRFADDAASAAGKTLFFRLRKRRESTWSDQRQHRRKCVLSTKRDRASRGSTRGRHRV